MPIQVMPNEVMAMLGIGLDSRLGAPMKLTAQATNASIITSGSAPVP